jgi:perosamine synthetase
VARLTGALRDVPGLRPFANKVEGEAVYFKVGWQYDATVFGLSRERFVAAVRAEGIALDEGFRALQVGRSGSRFRAAGPLDEAERTHRGAVVLHHPVLLGEDAEIDDVARAVRQVHAHADRLR